jgi:hypothetical protein
MALPGAALHAQWASLGGSDALAHPHAHAHAPRDGALVAAAADSGASQAHASRGAAAPPLPPLDALIQSSRDVATALQQQASMLDASACHHGFAADAMAAAGAGAEAEAAAAGVAAAAGAAAQQAALRLGDGSAAGALQL